MTGTRVGPRGGPVRVLVEDRLAGPVSRRLLLRGFAAVGVGALAGCASDRAFAPTAEPDGVVEDRLNVYSWGDYNAPETITQFRDEFGTEIQMDSFSSNEQLIAKLGATRGTSGYDVVVPTGNYIPMMSENGLLVELDHSLLPDLDNLDPAYRDQPWDPGNRFSVCKNWGTTGFVYDSTRLTRPMESWEDFLDAATNEASGSLSILDDPAEITAIYFAANGIDLNTTREADFDACEDYLVQTLAQHITAFTSNPSLNLVRNDFMLMQSWNGDARSGMLESDTLDKWRFVFPTPTANLWMDNWSIATGTQRPDAAYALINFMLTPEVGLQELQYIGYPTGLAGQEELAAEAGVEFPDLVFPAPDVVKRLTPLEITETQSRIVSITNAMKAKAGS